MNYEENKNFWKRATFMGVAGVLFGLLSINNVIYEETFVLTYFL